MKAKLVTVFVIITMLMIMIAPIGQALAGAPNPDPDSPAVPGYNNDDVPHPLGDAQKAARQEAFQAKLAGKDNTATFRIQQDKLKHYVELDRLGEDKIWTLLTEFGSDDHPSYPTAGLVGPLHNQIPQPDRTVDNTTIWAPDFSPAYFQNILFSGKKDAVSMRNFYIENSSNRYAVNGEVSDWTVLPYNAARYGRNACGDIVCSNVWNVMKDGSNAWYTNQLGSMSADDINAYLSQFDVWDRYDYDGDGDFNEPDGYIDHFQAVHAGEGEETGGGALGTDAIWSHRWYAWYNNIGLVGPSVNGVPNLAGGIRVGNSNYWIGDYTIEPENGGVGVFAHEFGHDLGLPDLYDTSGNTGGAENSTGFWTLYSSGSYGASGKPADGIGSKPIQMSALEKLMLGWSNYKYVDYKQKGNFNLGPAEYNTKQPQALVIRLPDKHVSQFIGNPYAGSYFYHSGSGNDLDNSMTRTVTLPGSTAPANPPVVTSMLTAKVRYEIEQDWDYAYLTVNGTPVHTNLSTASDPNGQNLGEGITGSSGGSWVDLTADLSDYDGQTVTIGFRYWTDGAVAEAGFGVDDLAIPGQSTDGAETDPGWTFNGFFRTTGTVDQSFANYYVAEFRQYNGYDKGLQTSPYNFGFLNTKENWVEHFPYQDGLLVWYLDYSFVDNNVGDNCAGGRCGGLFLPVDAHPDLLIRPDNGKVWRPRIQSYDSTFGLQKTDKICLHINTTFVQCYGNLKANPTFDDTKSYWKAPNPAIGNYGWASVPLPGVGVKLTVVKQGAKAGDFMEVKLNKK